MKRLIVSACLLALAAGCAGSKNIPDENMAQANFYADVNAMKSRIQELRVRVEELEGKTGGKGGEVTLEDVNTRLSRLEDIVTRLSQTLSVDVGQRALAGPAQTPGQSRDSGPSAPDMQYPVSSAPAGSYGGQPFQAGPHAQAPTSPVSDNPAEAIYNMGMEAYSARNYDRAVSLFTEMLKSYPTDRLAPSAMFWQADSNFQLGDYGRAAIICQDLIQKYPGNSLTASAMLKQAQAFKRLGRDQPAKILLQEVVQRYPGTAEAKSAQAQLQGLR